MAGSSKQKKKATSAKPAKPADKPSESAPVANGVPTGVRRLFLIASLAFLSSTGLPWGRRASPIQWIAGWVAHSDWSDRALALHMALPLLMLVAVASRETAPRPWSRVSVASMSFFALTSITIVSFGDALPPRPPTADMLIYQDIPRVIRSYAGWPAYVLRALLFAPAALVAGWALSAKGTERAAIANRVTLALTAAGTALVWAPMRGGFGYWVGLATSLALLVLAPLVEDVPETLDAKKRRQIAGASALWFVALAALALTRARRF